MSADINHPLGASWQEIRDEVRLWCRLDPQRCLLEIVHRGVKRVIDLTEFGLIFAERAPESAEGESDDDRLDNGKRDS